MLCAHSPGPPHLLHAAPRGTSRGRTGGRAWPMAFVVVVVVVVVVAVAVNALPNVGGTRHEPHETHTRARHAPAKDPEGDNGLVYQPTERMEGQDGRTKFPRRCVRPRP